MYDHQAASVNPRSCRVMTMPGLIVFTRANRPPPRRRRAHRPVARTASHFRGTSYRTDGLRPGGPPSCRRSTSLPPTSRPLAQFAS
jgi:hypothetical protein